MTYTTRAVAAALSYWPTLWLSLWWGWIERAGERE